VDPLNAPLDYEKGMSGHPTWRKREYPAVQLPEGIASGNKSQTRWDKHGRSKTSLFRGRVERRLVTREDDTALQALGVCNS
jgi:hypothetical protein